MCSGGPLGISTPIIEVLRAGEGPPQVLPLQTTIDHARGVRMTGFAYGKV
jgi:hypothetical protein